MSSTNKSRAKRYERLIRNMGMTNGNTPLKTEAKTKRKPPADVAKAAEAKRRKIEEEDRDPAADDDDGRVDIKPEPGVNPYIKQEPGMNTHIKQEPEMGMGNSPGYNMQPFHGNRWRNMQVQQPVSMHPAGSHNDFHPPSYGLDTLQEIHSGKPHPDNLPNGYHNSLPPPQPSTVHVKQEPDHESTRAHQSSPSTLPTTEDDSIFREFCNSELYMAPMLRESPTPPASPENSNNANRSINAAVARRASSVIEAAPAPRPAIQPECIVLD
jgi:hypothetical protein